MKQKEQYDEYDKYYDQWVNYVPHYVTHLILLSFIDYVFCVSSDYVTLLGRDLQSQT